MDGSAASVSDVSAIWAALQAADDGPLRPAQAAAKSYAVAGFTDDAADEEEDDDEDDDEDAEDDEDIAPVVPRRLAVGGGGGGGLLPSSFYSATGSGGLLPDVVPTFLLPTHRSSYGMSSTTTTTTTTAASSSEMFLDDILHAHDDAFSHATPSSSLSTPRLTPERLSQLEDNYERKKKRAKINRRDLNSRFQELMDLLQLKEDRKLNRAKVLEKAIEQIHKLTDELRLTRQQLQRASSTTTPAAPAFPPPASLPMHMPMPMPQWSPGATMAAHPMMWMPMLPTPRAPPPTRPSSARARSSTHKNAKTMRSVSSQTQTSPEKPKVSPPRRVSCKRGREMAETETEASVASSLLVWIALEVPTLLELCDAWTLSTLLRVSSELSIASRCDALWQRLCARRWRLNSIPSNNAMKLWRQLDSANEMPRVGISGVPTLVLASGRCGRVGLWASLVRRSNGRTTRTVLVDGKPVVRQVVELHLLVQNLDADGSLQLSNDLRVVGKTTNAFELVVGENLAPGIVTLNGVATDANVGDVQLFYNDVCVLNVFVACEGLDLEQQFLDRVDGVEMQCVRRTHGMTETVGIIAHASKHKTVQIAEAIPTDKSV